MSHKERDPASSRLDVIIRLLLDRQRKDNKEITIGDQIVMLESTGLRAKEAAAILGVDANQLTSYRRTAKKRAKP